MNVEANWFHNLLYSTTDYGHAKENLLSGYGGDLGVTG